MSHIRSVCVFAGSNAGVGEEYRHAAAELGRVLAAHAIAIVYGGAHVGLMGVVADAALAAGGRVTGVIPESLVVKELAHRSLTELRVVGSMHERKALMADLADAFVALPGGWGTWEEFFEVLTWGQLGLHRKPCGLLNARGYFDPLLAFVDHAIAEGFVRREQRSMICIGRTATDLLRQFATYEPPSVSKWIDREET